MTFNLPKPKSYYVAILRPYKLREPFTQKGWDQVGEQVEMVMNMTRSDIDDGASGYVMVDKNLNPTGAPPPDPEGAYCMVCRQRIWAHDDHTAFPTMIGEADGWFDVSGGACCKKCSQLSDEELRAKVAERLGLES
jgi:hypothetical protein